MNLTVKGSAQRYGQHPGSLIHVGPQRVEAIRIRFIDYDRKDLEERDVETVDECFPLRGRPTVSWINVDGLHDVALISRLAKEFGLHPLLVEDVVNPNQRAKVDDFGEQLYVVVKMLRWNEEARRVEGDQFSVVLGDGFVLTFQECYGDVLEPVRERIRKKVGRIRKLGSDYLAYALLDAVVDGYFVVLERVGEQIEALEDRIMTIRGGQGDLLERIHALRRDVTYLRKLLGPVRELAAELERGGNSRITEEVMPYLRDLSDHAIRVDEHVASYRELVSGLQDVHLVLMSNKMNEIMKVLTIFAAIFIPLTFIAGIYGMNFDYMPETKLAWGYPAALGAMVLTAAGLLFFFRRKGWI